MTQRYDVVVVGGGPAGSAAAWRAVTTGARVMILDQAVFPRDKPCGEGLTPHAVSCLQKMGLAAEVAEFHRVNRATVFSPHACELTFPQRAGMPDHGHTVRRVELDTLLLANAVTAGAELREAAEVVGPIIDDTGRVTGVRLQHAGQVSADAVIAADGAYSPISRALKLNPAGRGYSAIAIRAEMAATRPYSDSLDIYSKLVFRGDRLPGYGWVFPLGGGRVNVGLGYVNSYKNWYRIDAPQLLGEFLTTLPGQWALPSIDELKRAGALQAGRLPMAFVTWPPWRPGVLFAGDALGAAGPASGTGIAKALQSGLAAGECAIAALTNGGPDDFDNYTEWIRGSWGRGDRRDRYVHKPAGVPQIAEATAKVFDGVRQPTSRVRRQFWDGWHDARQAARRDRQLRHGSAGSPDLW